MPGLWGMVARRKDMKTSRNKKSLESFTKYCEENSEQRFFQALRNWFGVPFIGVSNDREKWDDTFYWEEDKDYKIQ